MLKLTLVGFFFLVGLKKKLLMRKRERERESEREREREREEHWFVVPLIYAFINCFLYVP